MGGIISKLGDLGIIEPSLATESKGSVGSRLKRPVLSRPRAIERNGGHRENRDPRCSAKRPQGRLSLAFPDVSTQVPPVRSVRVVDRCYGGVGRIRHGLLGSVSRYSQCFFGSVVFSYYPVFV